MWNRFYIEKDTSQNGHDVEIFITVVKTNIEVLYDKFSKFMPNQNLLKIKNFFDDVRLQ